MISEVEEYFHGLFTVDVIATQKVSVPDFRTTRQHHGF
jgi:hypothetical protein